MKNKRNRIVALAMVLLLCVGVLEWRSKEIESKIASAEEHIVQGDYHGAIAILEDAQSFTRENEEIISRLRQIESGREYGWVGNTVKQSDYNSEGQLRSYVISILDAENRMIQRTAFYPDGALIQSRIFEYNAVGNLTGEMGYDDGGKIIFERTNEYDENGNAIEGNWCDSEGGVDIGRRTIYEYNEAGNSTKEMYYDETDRLMSCLISKYDENGALIWSKSCDAFGEITEYYTYEYDEKGNLKKYTTYNSAGEIIEHSIYEHDEAGNQIRSMYYMGADVLSSVVIRKYDANGNHTKYVKYDADGEIYRTETYEYDTHGNVVGNVWSITDSTSGFSEIHEYDAENRPTKTIRCNSAGTIVNVTEYSYLPAKVA